MMYEHEVENNSLVQPENNMLPEEEQHEMHYINAFKLYLLCLSSALLCVQSSDFIHFYGFNENFDFSLM